MSTHALASLARGCFRLAPRLQRGSTHASRPLSTSAVTRDETEDILNAPREYMDYDVVIVGGGPAGLAASIRIKQLAEENGTDFSVCVVEKGAEIGAHILSGNVFEPRALNELIPNWKELGAPIDTPVLEDKFLFLTEEKSVSLPNALLPSELHNDGNYVISLGKLTRWLGEQAENLGVEVFAGFSASEVLYKDGAVKGIATRDAGINKDGTPKGSFARGVELRARQTIFAEGCRGSCSEDVMEKLGLREDCDPQTYGLGVKEVWEVPEGHPTFKPGFVQHTLGWPLQNSAMSKTYGGSFLYHMKPNLVLIGMVVGLDYENPYLSPYEEFQRWKHHPSVAQHLEGAECISYGARCLNEGGFHSIPKLTFPGGALVGCSAGFLNAVKIKGSHTAIKSGMLAGDAVYNTLLETGVTTVETGEIPEDEKPLEPATYQSSMEESWVWDELKKVRNVHAGFHYGFLPGVIHAGASCHVLRGMEPWKISNTTKDSAKTKPAAECEPIEYPKPDGKLSFDLLSNLARSGTYHEDQPAHLRLKDGLESVPADESLPVYAGPEQRFCPARVYEYSDGSENPEGKPQLIINAQNCVHCKCCSIKMPKEYINWTVPEGGGGPAYEVM